MEPQKTSFNQAIRLSAFLPHFYYIGSRPNLTKKNPARKSEPDIGNIGLLRGLSLSLSVA